MADNNVYNGLVKSSNNNSTDNQIEAKKSNNSCFKEAVCIDAYRVYDSCADKDCLQNLNIIFSFEKKIFEMKIEIEKIYSLMKNLMEYFGFVFVN